MFFRYYHVILTFFMLGIFTNSYAKIYEELHVCSEAGFEPYEMKTKSGKWIGYEIDLVKRFSKETDRKLILIDMKFDDALTNILSQKTGCDIVASAVSINERRENIMLFTTPTYEAAYAGITRLSDKDKFDTYNKINRKGVKVGVEEGTDPIRYASLYLKNVTIVPFKDNSQIVSAINSHKIDVWIDDSVYLSVAQRRNSDKIFFIRPDELPTDNSTPFPSNLYGGVALALRKSDTALKYEFDTFFNSLKISGDLRKIKNYYFQDMGWIKEMDK